MLKQNKILLLVIVYFVVVFNVGFWQQFWEILQTNGIDQKLLWTMPFFVIAVMYFIYSLIFWRFVHKIWVPLFLVVGAAAAYATMTQGIYFDKDQIVNVLQTNPHEAGSWINLKFILWLTITGIAPAVAYVKFVHWPRSKTLWHTIAARLLGMVAAILVIGIIASFAYQNYASFFRNHKEIVHKINPNNVLGAVLKNAYVAYDDNRPFVTIGLDAKHRPSKSSANPAQPDAKNVLVLVVGETTRAQNWGLSNNNNPNTTPQLAAIADVINYPDVRSCGTATAISLPCLFSNMDRADYSASTAAHSENVLDIVQRAGLYVSWKDNDGGCKRVCDRLKINHPFDANDKQQCKDGLCYDTKLLEGLADELKNMPEDGVIVLHTVGSHGPAYFERYPESLRHFTPTCDSNQLQDCDQAALENTYNNTVLAVDDMLAKTIKILNNSGQNVALWYFSDHGESLGEKGIYLHGAPYAVAPDQQTHIPMIFWANDEFYRAKNLDKRCLTDQRTKPYSHDFIFSSLLGLMDIETQEYKQAGDLFLACRDIAGNP